MGCRIVPEYPQALNFTFEGAQQIYSDLRNVFVEKRVNLYWNFAKATTAKAQGPIKNTAK